MNVKSDTPPHLTVMNGRWWQPMHNCRERLPQALLVRRTLEAPERCLPPLAGRGLSLLADDNKLDEDLARPLLVGYLRRELLVGDGEVGLLEHLMSGFAHRTGYAMGFIFVEQAGSWPAAFERLIDTVVRNKITAVVLPSLAHFALLEIPHDVKGAFERATGAQVLLLDSP